MLCLLSMLLRRVREPIRMDHRTINIVVCSHSGILSTSMSILMHMVECTFLRRSIHLLSLRAQSLAASPAISVISVRVQQQNTAMHATTIHAWHHNVPSIHIVSLPPPARALILLASYFRARFCFDS